MTPFVVAAAYIALYAAKRWNFYRLAATPTGAGLLFVLLTFAIGPGLIVNLGLKDHAGRPRPQCMSRNSAAPTNSARGTVSTACAPKLLVSSGEGSEGFWMIAPALEAPGPLRAPLVAGAALYGVVTSVLRMAFGGHFLSDVVAACLIMLLVIAAGVRLRRGAA